MFPPLVVYLVPIQAIFPDDTLYTFGIVVELILLQILQVLSIPKPLGKDLDVRVLLPRALDDSLETTLQSTGLSVTFTTYGWIVELERTSSDVDNEGTDVEEVYDIEADLVPSLFGNEIERCFFGLVLAWTGFEHVQMSCCYGSHFCQVAKRSC